MEHYIKDCTGGVGLDDELNSLQSLAIDILLKMANSTGEQIRSISESLGDGVTLQQPTEDALEELPNTVSDEFPSVITNAFQKVKCRRISDVYYAIKAPVCCDVAVSMEWIAWPLSVMGLTMLSSFMLSCCIGKRAFPQQAEENEEKAGNETKNPVADDED